MSISKRLRFEVFKRDSFTCQYCGAKPPDTVLEVDHVHPKSHGGRDDFDNLTTACLNCNRGKAGSPVPRIWTLTDGIENVRGPRHDEKVVRAEMFPAYWVFQAGDKYEFYEDELDIDAWFTAYEQRLKWGHPMNQAGKGRPHVADQWHNGYTGHRELAGFYLPRNVDFDRLQLLAWYTLPEALGWVLTISTAPYLEDPE